MGRVADEAVSGRRQGPWGRPHGRATTRLRRWLPRASPATTRSSRCVPLAVQVRQARRCRACRAPWLLAGLCGCMATRTLLPCLSWRRSVHERLKGIARLTRVSSPPWYSASPASTSDGCDLPKRPALSPCRERLKQKDVGMGASVPHTPPMSPQERRWAARAQVTSFPLYDQIQPMHVEAGIGRALDEVEAALAQLEASVQPTWEGLVDPMTRMQNRLDSTWGIVDHLLVRAVFYVSRRLGLRQTWSF